MKYYSEFDLLNPKNFRFVTEFDESGAGIDYKAIPIGNIQHIPTVDVVEVIRCRDCSNYRKSPFGHLEMGWCIIHGCHHKQSFYCAYGEK